MALEPFVSLLVSNLEPFFQKSVTGYGPPGIRA